MVTWLFAKGSLTTNTTGANEIELAVLGCEYSLPPHLSYLVSKVHLPDVQTAVGSTEGALHY